MKKKLAWHLGLSLKNVQSWVSQSELSDQSLQCPASKPNKKAKSLAIEYFHSRALRKEERHNRISTGEYSKSIKKMSKNTE